MAAAEVAVGAPDAGAGAAAGFAAAPDTSLAMLSEERVMPLTPSWADKSRGTVLPSAVCRATLRCLVSSRVMACVV